MEELDHAEIPKLVLNPMGVATHVGIMESSEFEEKKPVTHDISFPGLIF